MTTQNLPRAGALPINSSIPLRIADEIRELVARGVLAPDIKLGQTELAERFETSRIPVREALKLLMAEGIIVHHANRGFFVAKLSSAEARQLFRLRQLVEDELLAQSRWPTEKELAELSVRSSDLETLLNSGNRARWWVKHREFHQMIFDLSPEKVMVREAMRLWMLTDRYRSLLPLPKRSSAERSIVRKHGLVQALTAGDRALLLRERTKRRQQFERLVLEVLLSRGL